MPGHDVGDGKRSQHRHHEGSGGDKNAELRVRGEEKNERPDIEHQLKDRIKLLPLHDHERSQSSSPTTARAKSRAANGARSSTLSPTPMKCTGSPNFSAIATRIPPRAVPSSLVMTSPVTPAVLLKISTWPSAF